jgi:IMP dehydrogenase
MELGQSFCFDDVLMEPLYSKIKSRNDISLETNIGINGRTLMLKTPLISSPMDTVTETDMAIKMSLAGGLGIIHRFMSIEEQVSQITKVKRFLQYIIQEPYCITPDATYNEIQNLSDKYNVSSFCVVSNLQTKEFLGIITSRDIEYMKFCQTSNQTSTQTKIKQTLTISDIISNQLSTLIKLESSNLSNLENTLKIAKELMLQNRIEKIPIVCGTTLKGLITLKNIKHYEDNKSKACVDISGALCVGAAIGIIGDYLERLDKLIQANVDLICIDVANGFNENVFNTIRIIRSKYPQIVLMVGNVCNWQGYSALSQFDVDCIRVGVGNGSICTTRLETGIGKGQFSAIAECFRYKISNTTLPNIICDGGSLGKTGNKVKALACGSSAIMLGRTLASTEESPGQIIFRNGRRFKYIRGMASTMANLSKQEKTEKDSTQSIQSIQSTQPPPSKKLKTNFTSEGVDGEQELTGSVSELIEQINGGIKSGMSYLGCENIIQLHDKSANNEIKFNLVTSIGMTETGIRVKIL